MHLEPPGEPLPYGVRVSSIEVPRDELDLPVAEAARVHFGAIPFRVGELNT